MGDLSIEEVKQAARDAARDAVQFEIVAVRTDVLHLREEVLLIRGEILEALEKKHRANVRRFRRQRRDTSYIQQSINFLLDRGEDGKPRLRNLFALVGTGPLLLVWHYTVQRLPETWAAVRRFFIGY